MCFFLNRPAKSRPDVSDINKYYFQSGGSFWIAVDCSSDTVIGTVGIKKEADFAVLKLFYVNPSYQRQSIG